MSADATSKSPYACPRCGGVHGRFVSRAGMPVVCPDCGLHFVVGVPATGQVVLPPAGSEAIDEINLHDLWPAAVEKRPAASPVVRHSVDDAADEINTYELLPRRVEKRPAAHGDDELLPRRATMPPRRGPMPQPRGPGSPLAAGSAGLPAARERDWEADREERLYRFRYAVDEPPKLVLLSGVFDFPTHPGVWQRWIVMSAAAFVAAKFVVSTLMRVGVLNDGGVSQNAIGGLLLGLPTIFITVVASSYITACLLAVVEDTASGCNRILEWPEGDWREWIWTLRFPIVVGFCALPAGAFFYELTGAWNQAANLAMLVVIPVLLLSQLETGSAFLPISLPIYRTLGRYPLTWLLFYLESGLLLIATGWLLRLAGAMSLELLLGAPIAIGVALIYARLLGRLAWYTAWEKEEPTAESPLPDSATVDAEEES